MPSSCGHNTQLARMEGVPSGGVSGLNCLDGHVDVGEHTGGGHGLKAEWDAPTEVTERTEGKGRGLKTFFGVEFEVRVKCSCGEDVGSVTLKDDIQTSSMDEMA